MPAPTTADELLDLLEKSGLLENGRASAYAQKLRAAGTFPADPTKLAQFLVRDGLLTYFQAEQLLQGKYKRFSLGKYKVLEKLGAGGMGTVFLCEHKLMRRRVAVKVLPLPKAEDKASLDRFYREARAIASVDHPNIVRAYDIDQDDNLHFLVMEWVDGTNLQDLVKKFGPLDAVRACHYIYGAAVGLQHAHEIGLVHRDIKPGNILVDRTGVVKILDLGLARLTHDTEDNLTRQNDENVLGTADYLAPEQALDSHMVDIRADIYSLGATFYFLLTGSQPFPEGSVAQKLIWHQNRPPRPIKSLRAEVPDELIAIVEKMMAKDPANRHQSPAEVMAALAPWVATPIPPPAEREMPTLSPAVVGARATGSSIGPPSVVGGLRTLPTSTSMSGAATVIGTSASGGTTPAPFQVPVAATPAAPGPAVWEDLGDDAGATLHDTGRAGPETDPAPATGRSSQATRRKPTPPRGVSKVWMFAAAGALVLIGGTIGAYFAFFKKKADETPDSPPSSASREIRVSKAGGENTVATLREALAKASTGDTIVITEPRLTEGTLPALRDRKNVTIESRTPDGRPAVIELIDTAPPGGTIFTAHNAEGLKVRNVVFDGKGRAEVGVQLSGSCPGAAFENVTVRGTVRTGFTLLNLTGEPGRPLVLDRVRVVLPATGQAGVAMFTSDPRLDTRQVTVRNSRFEGPGRAGVEVAGAAIDLEITNTRFYTLSAAAVVFVAPAGRTSKGTFANNTVFGCPAGLQFEYPAKDPTRCELRVAHNYFARTPAALKANDTVPGLAAENNLHDPQSGPGAPPMPGITRLENPTLPNPNPDDDATFLLFPAGTAPTAGGKPVGAP